MALTKRARRSNCSGRTSLRDALCGSRIRRDLLDGGFCQGLVSDRSSGESDGSSALSDLSRTTSLSSYTTIPATSYATAPRSSESTLLVVDLSCLVARCSFRTFTTTASMSAVEQDELPAGIDQAGNERMLVTDRVYPVRKRQRPHFSSDLINAFIRGRRSCCTSEIANRIDPVRYEHS